jgi:hypothetical protein
MSDSLLRKLPASGRPISADEFIAFAGDLGFEQITAADVEKMGDVPRFHLIGYMNGIRGTNGIQWLVQGHSA